jgi:hypothetical protein
MISQQETPSTRDRNLATASSMEQLVLVRWSAMDTHTHIDSMLLGGR